MSIRPSVRWSIMLGKRKKLSIKLGICFDPPEMLSGVEEDARILVNSCNLDYNFVLPVRRFVVCHVELVAEANSPILSIKVVIVFFRKEYTRNGDEESCDPTCNRQFVRPSVNETYRNLLTLRKLILRLTLGTLIHALVMIQALVR